MMQRLHIWPLLALVLLCASCSTQKNTWATRTYHQAKVRYNIQHNGNIAYEEGLRAIADANQDDYSTVLPLYPVSNHDAAQAATSNMDRVIEKCRKSIKLHSIKSRPKPDPKKRQDPKYRAWLKQPEFNNQLGDAWIRLAEAEFHKGDFLGAVSTFNYIRNYYDYDPDIVARCQLWIARAYAEMGWLYEAEDMLAKVKVDALSRKHAPLYSSVSADVLLKTGHLHEAIPYVKLAAPHEKRKINRPRFHYVLAQLYEAEGNKAEAISAYTRVIQLTPPVVMDFNARIRRAQLQGTSALKTLTRMTRRAKYKDQLDRIYGAIGNIYLAAGDTAAALENYRLAIDNSRQAGSAKADVLVRTADLCYLRQDYADAQPCYREAVGILANTHPDYARVQLRSETLDELIRETTVVTLQDSLQRLSRLSEEEQRAVVDRIIADLLEAEKKAEEDAALAAREAMDEGPLSVNTSRMIGGAGQTGEWYFYNSQLLQNGRQEFARRWGRRPLEDNWRRLSKTMSSFSIFDTPADADADLNEQSADSISTWDAGGSPADRRSTATIATDPHQPEYYLQQIPRTPEDIAASDSLIADALNNLVYIYQDRVRDTLLADAALADLERRFPADPRLADLYYMYYLNALKSGDDLAVQDYRERIMTRFPDSKQAVIVGQPDYFDRLRRMAAEQDSLYEDTYRAFAANDFRTVKANKQHAEQEYPLSPLMPRFLFLNAIAVARTEGQQPFIDALRDMVTRYPTNELGAMAKDMLAMMGQGMESKQGTSGSNLADLRAAIAEEELSRSQTASEDAGSFSPERRLPSLVLIVLPDADTQSLNTVLYEVALFNFSQFLIRDFNLRPLPTFGPVAQSSQSQTAAQSSRSQTAALAVEGFDSMDEAEWYIGLMQQNEPLQASLRSLSAPSQATTASLDASSSSRSQTAPANASSQATTATWDAGGSPANASLDAPSQSAPSQASGVLVLPITEDNFPLLNTRYSLDDYRTFLAR
ncbi:MAG: tetratricopeptide repeat protein [Paludibacteraceae bacterium]|nr:tetratricopeptide repeat protein [Paludibacteraceae bacterium]